ncbi:unnamed protein product [Prunus armeniaca]|uniref:Uncharacterized protein n=1 Tax=Prunus armeniaca TaxID=36596 RepID=A0A6J5VC97_PRUAR|nr:unnamed protein product [Prunus armeniaca]
MGEQGGAPQSPLPLPEFDDDTIGHWASHLPDVAGVMEVIERAEDLPGIPWPDHVELEEHQLQEVADNDGNAVGMEEDQLAANDVRNAVCKEDDQLQGVADNDSNAVGVEEDQLAANEVGLVLSEWTDDWANELDNYQMDEEGGESVDFDVAALSNISPYYVDNSGNCYKFGEENQPQEGVAANGGKVVDEEEDELAANDVGNAVREEENQLAANDVGNAVREEENQLPRAEGIQSEVRESLRTSCKLIVVRHNDELVIEANKFWNVGFIKGRIEFSLLISERKQALFSNGEYLNDNLRTLESIEGFESNPRIQLLELEVPLKAATATASASAAQPAQPAQPTPAAILKKAGTTLERIEGIESDPRIQLLELEVPLQAATATASASAAQPTPAAILKKARTKASRRKPPINEIKDAPPLPPSTSALPRTSAATVAGWGSTSPFSVMRRSAVSKRAAPATPPTSASDEETKDDPDYVESDSSPSIQGSSHPTDYKGRLRPRPQR